MADKPALPCLLCGQDIAIFTTASKDHTINDLLESEGLICFAPATSNSQAFSHAEYEDAVLIFGLCDECVKASGEKGNLYLSEDFETAEVLSLNPWKTESDVGF